MGLAIIKATLKEPAASTQTVLILEEAAPEVASDRKKTQRFEDNPAFIEAKKQVVDEIKCIMGKDGVNNAELAERMKAQASMISQVFKVNVGIQLSTIVRIAEALDCDVEFNLVLRHTAQN